MSEFTLDPGPVTQRVIHPPQFDLPFRLDGNDFATVPQDTEADIMNCVEAVMRYHPGQRAMLPEFGIRDLAFEVQPIDGAALIQAVSQHEPRAEIYVTSETDKFDALWANVTVSVAIADQTEGD